MADGDLWRDRNKVFVAGIPATWDDAMLAQKFRPFGEMFQSKVVYDAKTGKSKGFGFITFSEYVHALEAVSAMNQTKWENRILNVRFLQPKAEKAGGSSAAAAPSAVQPARRPTKVFGPVPEGCTSVYVGNLAYDITDKVLRKVFATCGDIKAVRLAAHIETKEFRGFGYVQFYDSAACEKAVQQDGMIVMGRPMNLDYGARDEVVEKAREDLTKKLKKGVCHKFQSGQCPRGDDCKFAHVLSGGSGSGNGNGVDVDVAAAGEVVAAAEEEEEDGGIPICQSFLKGKCKRGESCKFRHVEPSATPATAAATPAMAAIYRQPAAHIAVQVVEENMTPVCQNYLKGKCTRGEKCRFRHSDESATETLTMAAAVALPVPARVPAFERSRYAPAVAPEGRVPRATSRVAAPVEEIPICQNFQKGTCKRGDSCRFRHVEASATPVAPAAQEIPPVIVSVPDTTAAAVDGAAVAPVTARVVTGEPTAADEDAPICQNYLKTKCKRGAACRFRHVDPSSIPVVEAAPPLVIPAVVPTISICKNYQRGRCMRGTSCRFAHTDGDVAMEEQAAAPAVATTYEASVANAHSEYQKRFQSVCYNWQNARSCVRGDQCPFYHDGAAVAVSSAVAVAAQTKSSRKETAQEVQDDDEEVGEEDERVSKKSKKEKKEKKEKKSKKDKKRKAAESESDSDSDDEAKKKKKKKKHKKHKE